MNKIKEILEEINQDLIKGKIRQQIDHRLSENIENKIKEAINYSQCCKELKGKEKMTYLNWLLTKGFKYVGRGEYANMHGTLIKSNDLGLMYTEYLNL